ncbi:MAG: hypothetical protein HZA63_04085 [Rhodocyclales bacterium]|nr:hypothetical protein [Rhodocyclales bacterium]
MSAEDSLPDPDCHCWVPIARLTPGMVIARPVQGGHGNQVTLRIAVGSSVTSSMIGQLVNKGVECVAVRPDAAPDEAARAEAARRLEQRLAEIFGDQPNDACRSLRDALLACGPSTC